MAQGWLSQHFNRCLQAALVGNYEKAWRQYTTFIRPKPSELIQPTIETLTRVMINLMRGREPSTPDLKFAGFIPSNFAIKNVKTGLCIHPKTGDNPVPDGTIAHLWEGCDDDYVKFEFTDSGAIRHITSGKCLHPHSGRIVRGIRFHFWSGCDLEYLPFQYRLDRNLFHLKSGQCLVPVGTSMPVRMTQLNIWDYCAEDERTTFELAP